MHPLKIVHTTIIMIIIIINPDQATAGQKVAHACGETLYECLVPTLSSEMPLEVSPHERLPNIVDRRPYLDYFSWQSFVALIWPADPNADRGTPLSPNNPKTFFDAYRSNNARPVFETLREGYALFPPTGQPIAWSSKEEPPYTPCEHTDIKGERLTQLKKRGVVTDIVQVYSIPLIDQNKNYTRYEVRINRTEYDHVVENKWYLKKHQTPLPLYLPINSIELKMAWRKMVEKDDLSRYFVVEALVPDTDAKQPKPGSCVVEKLGLVGLHIMQKTAEFPQWVWSTFSQVDNVAPGHDAPAGLTASYNNGQLSHKTLKQGFDKMPAKVPPVLPIANRTPVEVARIVPIPNTPTGKTAALPFGVSTQGINQAYQKLLKGTPWEFYELVISQWPSEPENIEKAGVPFPEEGVANITMETYLQGRNGTTCMECHKGVIKHDFSSFMRKKAH